MRTQRCIVPKAKRKFGSDFFMQNMDSATLKANNIKVTELKHSSNVIELYQIHYDRGSKTLTLQPKDPAFDFGSGNSITVTLSGDIQNQQGQRMGAAYSWTFRTAE